MDALELQTYSRAIEEIARGGAGTGAAATATLKATGGIRSAKVNAAGSGYSLGDVLTVAGGTGGTLTVTGVTTAGAVKSVTKTTAGSGYANHTGVATTVAPSGGTNCTVDTVIEFEIDEISVDDSGGDYVSIVAKFTGGGNPNWSYGTATVSDGELATITAPEGVTFTSVPTIVLEPGGPATVSALVAAVRVVDDTLQLDRLKAALEHALQTEILTPEQAPLIRDALDQNLQFG